VAVSFRSNFSGKSRRGRVYHVGLADSTYTGDYLSPTVITTLETAYENLGSSAAGADFTHVVMSYVENGEPRTTGFTSDITAYVVTDNIVDSMDSRKPKP